MDILKVEPHGARIKAAIELGKQSLSSPDARAKIASLASDPGFQAQSLIIYACYGSRDTALLQRVLASTCSKTLRELARTVLLDVCPDAAVGDLLVSLYGSNEKPGKLLRILHKLRKGRGSNPTAHLVHSVILLADPSATFTAPPSGSPVPPPILKEVNLAHATEDRLRLLAHVLPFGNEQQVTLLLAKYETRVTGMEHWVDLPLLVQWHPGPTVEFLARQHHTTRARLMQAAQQALYSCAPEALLTLFNSLPAESRSAMTGLAVLLTKRFPERMVDQLMTLAVQPENDHTLHGYMVQAAAARKAMLEQRAAAHAARQNPGVAQAATSPPPTPAAPGPAPSASASAGDMDYEEGSWVAPTSVGSVASMSDTASMSSGGDGGAKAGDGDTPAVDSPGLAAAPHPVYALAARKALHGPTLNVAPAQFRYSHKKWRNVAALPDGLIIQACMTGLRPVHWVLRSVPVQRRVGIYKSWRTWWEQQAARLDDVQSQLVAQAQEAQGTVNKMRSHLQSEAIKIWQPCAEMAPWLPWECLVDLVKLLLKQFKNHDVAETLAYDIVASGQLPSAEVLKLLRKWQTLWGQTDNVIDSKVKVLLKQLSVAQQAELLASSKYLESKGAIASPSTAVTTLLQFQKWWKPACEVYAHRMGLRKFTLETPPSSALLAILEALPNTSDRTQLLAQASVTSGGDPLYANPASAALPLLMQQCLWRGTLTDVHMRWEAGLSPSPWVEGSAFQAAVQRLAGTPGEEAHATYTTLGIALNLLGLHCAYKPWITTAHSSGHRFQTRTNAHNPSLASLLPAPARLALVLRAARDSAAMHGADWHQRVLINKSDAGGDAGKVVKLLITETDAMLEDLTSEQVKQISDALPGLWIKAPGLLAALAPADRLPLLQSWQATRASVEDAVARLLASAPAQGAVTRATGEAGSMDIDSAGAEEAVRVSLMPRVAESMAQQARALLTEDGDPVLKALLKGSAKPTTPQERSLLYTLARDAMLNEWVTVPLQLLPVPIRAQIARARILRATEKMADNYAGLFAKIQSDLPYLTWRDIMDTPCFKDRLQARDAGERASALQFLVSAVLINPDLLPNLLNAIHMRRREQDETRSKVLSTLSDVVLQLASARQAANLAATAQALSEAVGETALPEGHEEAPELRQAVLAAALQAAAGKPLSNPEDAERRAQALLAQLPALSQICKDALAARDLSKESISHLVGIAVALLPTATEWAATHLAMLMTHGGLAAVPLNTLTQSIETALSKFKGRFDAMRTAALSAVEEASAGRRGEWKFLSARKSCKTATEQAGPQAPKKPHHGRQKHKNERANATKTLQESKCKVQGAGVVLSDSLQEAYLLDLTSKVLPTLMLALAKRQDGLYAVLKLTQAWQNLLFELGPKKSKAVDTWRAIQPAFTELLLGLLEPMAALRNACSLPGVGEAASVGMVAWYVDQVMLRSPDNYAKVKHLFLTSDRVVAALVKPHIMNCMHNSLPVGRLDLLLPFIEDNIHLPEVAAKAVKLLFTHHGAQVASIVPQLLARDPTFILIPPIFWFVVRSRQDLLPSLAAPSDERDGVVVPVKGMFAEGAPRGMVTSQKDTRLRNMGRGRRGTRGGRGGRSGRGGARAAKPFKVNTCGWKHGSDLFTSLWLGVPNLGFLCTARLGLVQQEIIGQELVAALVSKGTLDVHVVRSLVKRLASLPALPPKHLLNLLEVANAVASNGPPATEHAGSGQPPAHGAGRAASGPGQGPSGPAGGEAGALPYEAVQDVVLGALVKLDDGSQAWGALMEALNKGSSSTALSAVSALLSADIRALAGPGAVAVAGAAPAAAADDGRAQEILSKLRQLPWQRPAVLREVIKLLGALAGRSPLAVTELVRIAAYAGASIKQAAVEAAKAPTAPDASPAPPPAPAPAAPVADTSDLPLPAGKELHRSGHLQLLTTLQDLYAVPEVRATFQMAAFSADKEIATSAAFVPSKAIQRAHPDSIPACVGLYQTLLDHPDKEVRIAAMKSWASAADTLTLAEGLPILLRMMAIKSKKSVEGTTATSSAQKWCMRVIGSSKKRRRGGAPGLVETFDLFGTARESDDDGGSDSPSGTESEDDE